MRHRSKSPYPGLDRLPTAFWLSSKGVIIPVEIHAETLMFMPEIFGLNRAPSGRTQIEAAMRATIARGWIRARIFPGGTADFQIHSADARTIGEISDLLYFYPTGIESVVLRTVEPWHVWPPLVLEDFLEGRHPSAWRTNPSKKGGTGCHRHKHFTRKCEDCLGLK